MSQQHNKPVLLMVGCGRMGGAILECALKGAVADVAIVDPRISDISDFLDGLHKEYGGVVGRFSSFDEFISAGIAHDYAMFAVKPQGLKDTLNGYLSANLLKNSHGAYVPSISVVAGVTVSGFKSILGEDAPVIRTMPNIPVSCGAGVTGFYASGETPDAAREFVKNVFSQGGVAPEVDREELIDAVTAVSGSGPAYFFYFVECLAQAGKELGLPEDVALKAATQTLCGAGRMAEHTAASALREQVTSPGGTTAAALNVFMENDNLRKIVKSAGEAAANRAAELAGMTSA